MAVAAEVTAVVAAGAMAVARVETGAAATAAGTMREAAKQSCLRASETRCMPRYRSSDRHAARARPGS